MIVQDLAYSLPEPDFRISFQRDTPAQIKPWLFFIYCKIYFKLPYVSPVAPQIITFKGAEPNF